MLSIHLHGKDDDATPWFYEGTIAELFRTWSVIGESVVFVEVSPGHLINLAHIERIVEEPAADEPTEFIGSEVNRALSCPHGYVSGTCSIKDAKTTDQCAGYRP